MGSSEPALKKVKIMSNKTEKKKEETAEEVFVRDADLNIHQRINKVMAEVHYIKKNKKIEIGKGSYSATGHDSVTALIHPLLVKYGINIVPTFNKMEAEMILVNKQVWENNKKVEKVSEMHRVRVDASFKWVNIDKPDDFIEQSWSGYGCDSSDKGPGMAISYIQRYIVLKTLHIETGEKDLEENDPVLIEHSPSVQKKVQEEEDIPIEKTNGSNGAFITAAGIVVLERKIKEQKIDSVGLKKLLDHFQVDALSELLRTDHTEMEKMITEKFSF